MIGFPLGPFMIGFPLGPGFCTLNAPPASDSCQKDVGAARSARGELFRPVNVEISQAQQRQDRADATAEANIAAANSNEQIAAQIDLASKRTWLDVLLGRPCSARSYRCAWRTAPSARAAIVHDVLQRSPHASIAKQGLVRFLAKFRATDEYSQSHISADCITSTFGFDLR